MSQIWKSSTTSPPPPDVPTDFVLDDGTAVPASNIINFTGVDSSESNDNGILTRANPNLSENIFVVLTNRLQGAATSTNGSNADIITFALDAVPAGYRMVFEVVGRDTATNDVTGYTLNGTAKTDGAAASVVEEENTDDDEDASLVDAELQFVASGNNIILRAIGPAGQTISYKSYGYYIKV